MGMVLLRMVFGDRVGLMFMALRPWAPDLVRIITTVYARANMVASGKMFVANSLPGYMLVMFAWNPLFHIIDQCRGFVFVNYNPHFTSISYPVYMSIIFIMLGLLGEFYTRKRASASWGAAR